MEFFTNPTNKVFKVIFRDLSRNEPFNVVNLWEQEKERKLKELQNKKLNQQNLQSETQDNSNSNSNSKNNSNNKNNSNSKNSNTNDKHTKKLKKKKVSKKEQILQKIQKSKEKDQESQDREYINNLTIGKIDMIELKNKITLMKTGKGVALMKIAFLKEAFKRQDITNTIDLYIEVRNYPFDNKKHIKLLEKIKKKCEKKLDMSIELFQLHNLGDRLPPLDFYNKTSFQLETWQKRVLHYIENRNNVFLSAPTSAGKTVLVTGSVIATDYKVLIILPTEALAIQVVSLIDKLINSRKGSENKKYALWTDNYKFGIDEKNKASYDILISTPLMVEMNLEQIHTSFDYIIFDEIHCLNYDDVGPSIERIIHYFSKSSFFAISATINNINELCQWWAKIDNKEIKTEIYKKRFINLERHFILRNNIVYLHPLSLITVDDLKDSKNNALDELAFCPKDIAQCWISLKSVFNDKMYKEVLIGSSPKEFFSQFKTYRITLTQSKLYETHLKNLLVKLVEKHEDKIKDLMSLFQDHNIENLDTLENYFLNEGIEINPNIINCIQQVKKNDKMPAITFISDSSMSMEYYKYIIQILEKKMKTEWPFFYEHQYQRKLIFDKLITYKKRLEDSKKKDASMGTKSGQREDNIKELLDIKFGKMLEKETYKQISELKSLYEKERQLIDSGKLYKSNNESNNEYMKTIILKNLDSYYKDIDEWKSVPYTSDFDRPPELCFQKVHLTEDDLKYARTILINEIGMTITHKNLLLLGLCYGIGIYLKTLPIGYLRCLQLFAQSRKIGILIADKTLSMGINMPFLSVILYQHKNILFDQMESVQMMGRCGRRNKDNTGHLIMCNINPKQLLLKQKTNITGSDIRILTMGLLPQVRHAFVNMPFTRKTISETFNPFIPSVTSTSIVLVKPVRIVKSIPTSADYYEETKNLWNTKYNLPKLSRHDKIVIWKSSVCYPYKSIKQGNLSGLIFTSFLKENLCEETSHLVELNRMNSYDCERSLLFLLLYSYFQCIPINNMTEIIEFRKTNKNIKILDDIIKYDQTVQAINDITLTNIYIQNSYYLYEKLWSQLKNNKDICKDSQYIKFIFNLCALLKILGQLQDIKSTNIYHSMCSLFNKFRKLTFVNSILSFNFL